MAIKLQDQHEPHVRVVQGIDDAEAFSDAVRTTLEALNAIYIADFDADDSGAREHVVEREIA